MLFFHSLLLLSCLSTHHLAKFFHHCSLMWYQIHDHCPQCSASNQYSMSMIGSPSSQFTPQSGNITFGYEWATPLVTMSGGQWQTTVDPGSFNTSSMLYLGLDLSQQDYYHSFDTMPPHHTLYQVLKHASPPIGMSQSYVSSLTHALDLQDPQAWQACMPCMPAGNNKLLGSDTGSNLAPLPNLNSNQTTSTSLNLVSSQVLWTHVQLWC